MASSNSDERLEEVEETLSPIQTNKSRNEASRTGNIFRDAHQSFAHSRPPVGMFHAFGSAGSNIPTMKDIQQGNVNPDGRWSGPGQRRNSQAHRESDFHVLHLHRQRTQSMAEPRKNIPDEKVELETSQAAATSVLELAPHDPSVPYENGYQFPPKHSKWQATAIFFKSFWGFFTTPFGFLVTIYGLNVVAWGGMLFLIICHATPAMSHPSWNDNSSGAKIWLEIDSQILNALFCVTGLGLIPWRFRDLYYLLQWRWKKNHSGLRHLAGIHRGWFRLQGSQEVDVKFNPAEDEPAGIDENVLAIPIKLTPDAPLTGERATATLYWKIDFVIWSFVINSFLQIMLCGFMWGYTRFNRPSWVVGLLISVACIVASAGGWMIFKEGKRVKKTEGVPVSKEDLEILKEMRLREGSSGESGNAV